MSQRHRKFARLATRLINRNGRDVTLRKLDRAPDDPNKPWRAGAAEYKESLVLKGVFLDYAEEEIDGVEILQGDQQCIVASGDAALDGKDLRDFNFAFVDGDRPFRITRVAIVQPGEVAVLHRLNLRQ